MATRRPAPTHKRIDRPRHATGQKPPTPAMSTASLFKHPRTGRTVDVGAAPVSAALFGFLYFAKHRVWKHFWGELLLAPLTGGISWLVYPIYAERIMRQALISRDWTAVPSPEIDRTAGQFLVLMVTLVWTMAFGVVMTFVATAYM